MKDKSFSDYVKENWGPESTGRFTSKSGGTTWSPSSNAQPYSTMSTPAGADPFHGNPPAADDDAIMGDHRMPAHFPFPLATVAERLVDYYMADDAVESNLNICIKQNPTLQGAQRDELSNALQDIKHVKALIRKISFDLERTSLTPPNK